jgi:hypothetical protein
MGCLSRQHPLKFMILFILNYLLCAYIIIIKKKIDNNSTKNLVFTISIVLLVAVFGASFDTPPQPIIRIKERIEIALKHFPNGVIIVREQESHFSFDVKLLELNPFFDWHNSSDFDGSFRFL